MNADPMVQRCFAHQHPEAYGRPPVDEPLTLTHRQVDADYVLATPLIPEEEMGNGESFA